MCSIIDRFSSDSIGNALRGSWIPRIPLSTADVFDVASCQFAMHYMFQSSAKAHHFLEQVSRHLKPGGVFIATTMDCRVVAEALSEQLYGCFDESQSYEQVGDMQKYAGIGAKKVDAADGGAEADPFAHIKAIAAAREQGKQGKQSTAAASQRVVTYHNDVGSEVLQLKFAEDMWTRLLRLPLNDPNNSTSSGDAAVKEGALDESAFGIKYTFTLHDSEEDAAVDAPEWVVPLGHTLRVLAAAHGLQVVEVQNFQDMAAEIMLNDGKLRR